MLITYKTEISEAALAFIKRNESGRLKPESLSFYENPTSPIAVFEGRGGEKNFIIGIAACSLDIENKKAGFNITVVSRYHRNEGLGTKLLSSKLAFLKNLDIPYECCVASDNGASLSMCLKNSLKLTTIERKERSSGIFNSFLLKSVD